MGFDMELIEAVKAGDTNKVCTLVENGANPNVWDDDERTALLWAAAFGYVGMVEELLKIGADLNARSKQGWTALMWAAHGDKLTVTRKLLQHGAKLEEKDNGGETALIWAAQSGNTAVFTAVNTPRLDQARDKFHMERELFNQDRMEFSGLCTRAIYYDHFIVQELLDSGADVNAKSNDNKTALMYAAFNGKVRVVKELLDRGADVNLRSHQLGWTALALAAFHGHIDVVSLLLNRGADAQAEDVSGMTALTWARQKGHEAVATILKAAEDR